MKSTKRDYKNEKNVTYPCLMEGKQSGSIYLMVEEEKGIVVNDGEKDGNLLGKIRKPLYRENLISFEGGILLEN